MKRMEEEEKRASMYNRKASLEAIYYSLKVENRKCHTNLIDLD